MSRLEIFGDEINMDDEWSKNNGKDDKFKKGFSKQINKRNLW